jgi:CDP-diacylglycerol--glycerol-3-phosphate 3-phosphatidyltransferase
LSIYALKPRFQALLRPLTRALYGAGVTANQVTIATCVVSIALGGWLAAAGPARSALFLAIPVWFFLRMALNAIDGMLAREHGQASKLGGYLNELTDVLSDAALYLPFGFLAGSTLWLVGLVVVLAIVSEMAGVMGVAYGAGRRYEGPMGKSDRAFVFSVIGLAVGAGLPVSAALDWVWAAMSILIALTIVNRVRRGLQ